MRAEPEGKRSGTCMAAWSTLAAQGVAKPDSGVHKSARHVQSDSVIEMEDMQSSELPESMGIRHEPSWEIQAHHTSTMHRGIASKCQESLRQHHRKEVRKRDPGRSASEPYWVSRGQTPVEAWKHTRYSPYGAHVATSSASRAQLPIQIRTQSNESGTS